MATDKTPPPPPCEEDDSTIEKHLPRDVLEMIMIRLPIKSIVRFKSVSKAWNRLTLDQRFARLHLQFRDAYYSTDEDRNLFMWSPSDRDRYRLAKFNGSELEVLSHLKFPDNLPRSSSSYSIVASCDGFFLLYDQIGTYLLWNPIIGSNFTFAAYLGYPGKAHGLCYDSVNDDYKVVYITPKWYTVYSCRDRSWTESQEFTYAGVSARPAGVTVGGVSYWVFCTPGVGEETDTQSNIIISWYDQLRNNGACNNCIHEIVYYDTAECGFKTLPKPNELRGTDAFRLTSLNGRLCLYRRSSNSRVHLQIWVLMHENNNEWIKLTDVRGLQPPLAERSCRVKPLYVTEDERIVLQDLRADGSRFVVYDIGRKTSERPWKLDDEGHSEVVAGLDLDGNCVGFLFGEGAATTSEGSAARWWGSDSEREDNEKSVRR